MSRRDDYVSFDTTIFENNRFDRFLARTPEFTSWLNSLSLGLGLEQFFERRSGDRTRVRLRLRVRLRVRVGVSKIVLVLGFGLGLGLGLGEFGVRVRGGLISTHKCIQGRVVRHAV